MADTTNLPGKQTLDNSTNTPESQAHPLGDRIGYAARSFSHVHFHPAPWPYEVQTTTTMQQRQLWPLPSTPIVWASIVDNPIPSTAAFIAWFVVLSLIGVVVWRRGGSPIPWFVTAIFLSFGAGLMDGLNALIGYLVARPRPTSPPIHVFMPEHGIPSFPSGHVENDLVYYGSCSM